MGKETYRTSVVLMQTEPHQHSWTLHEDSKATISKHSKLQAIPVFFFIRMPAFHWMFVGTVRVITIYTSLNSPQTAVPKDHVVPPWAQKQSVTGGDGFKPKKLP